jgi:enoyl-CoA hydratase/carnithine racemase
VNTVLIEHPRAEVAILRLNRPECLNALSWELVRSLHAALDTIDSDNRCRVVVLTGAGKGFCSGLDLKDQGNPGAVVEGPTAGPRAGLLAQNHMAGLIPHMRRIQQPLIAAIMWANLDVPNLEATIQLENRNQIMAGMSGEPEEAARAFFEKRKPRWTQG